jgi:hypothetical protein
MDLTRGIGIALLVAGVVFLIMGITATDAPVEKISETLTGKYTDQTIWYIGGGLAAAAAGLFMLIGGGRRGAA